MGISRLTQVAEVAEVAVFAPAETLSFIFILLALTVIPSLIAVYIISRMYRKYNNL